MYCLEWFYFSIFASQFICVILNSIATLLIGERGIISEDCLDIIPLKLLEMGCLPGTEVELMQVAPFNDPVYI
mgnify:FL=1